MSLLIKDTAFAGDYIVASVIGGVWIDPFGTLTSSDVLARAREFANGWTVSHATVNPGVVAGLGGGVHVYGRADGTVPTMVIKSQVENAMNSFLSVYASTVSVLISDSLSITPPDSESWQGTLQLIGVAVIALAVVWGVSQVKDIIK